MKEVPKKCQSDAIAFHETVYIHSNSDLFHVRLLLVKPFEHNKQNGELKQLTAALADLESLSETENQRSKQERLKLTQNE